MDKCKAHGQLNGRPFKDHRGRRCRNVTYPDGRHVRQVWLIFEGKWVDDEEEVNT